MDTTKASTPHNSSAGVLGAAFAATLVPAALIALGTASASLYFWGRDLHRFTQWISAYLSLFIAQLAIYVLACHVVLRWPDRSSRAARWLILGSIILFAVAFRVMLVPQRPYLSTDVYRYIWDGHVQAAGINPYRYAPDDPALTSLRDDKIYPNISGGFHNWLSPYPPAAQATFLAVTLIKPMSVSAFKAAMSVFDIITIVLLMLALARSGVDPARAVIFGWHPLVIFEGAHSGHIESAFITLLALALFASSRKRYALTGVALALATLVKLYPIVLLPAFLVKEPRDSSSNSTASAGQSGPGVVFGLASRLANRENLSMLTAFVATVGLAYLPYIAAGRNLFGYLDEYAREEGFTQSGERYFLLTLLRKIVTVPADVFLVAAAGCFISVAVWRAIRVKRDAIDVARGAMSLIGLYLLLTTPRYAWYYTWMIPFVCFAPRIGWLYLTSAGALLYLVWYTPLVYPEIPIWLGTVIYVPTLILLAWEHFRRDRSDAITSPMPYQHSIAGE